MPGPVVPLDLLIFVIVCLVGTLAAGVAGFAFGLISAASWLHAITSVQSAALIAAFAIVIQGASVPWVTMTVN